MRDDNISLHVKTHVCVIALSLMSHAPVSLVTGCVLCEVRAETEETV
jgi:hypothetical protein